MILKYNTIRNIENITENLQIGLEVLKSFGLKYWLSDGALWAIMRQGEVFEYDHDWDIGILGDMPDGFVDEMSKKMLPLEFSNEKIFGKQQGFAFEYKQWIFDCRFWYPAGKYLINAQKYPGESGWEIGTFYESAYLFDSLANIDYHGVKVPIPSQIENYLAERYGANWKILRLTGENRWWLYSKSFKNDNLIWEKIK